MDKGITASSINTSPVFGSDRAEGNLVLENPANNTKHIVVGPYLNETEKKA